MIAKINHQALYDVRLGFKAEKQVPLLLYKKQNGRLQNQEAKNRLLKMFYNLGFHSILKPRPPEIF